MKFLENIFGSKKKESSDIEDYKELDLSEYEDDFNKETVNMYIKIAEFTKLDMIPELKKEIYGGNIVIIDVSFSKHDKLIIDRAIKELQQVANDVHGDIAMVKDDQIIVTPSGVRIDRQKIK